MKKIAILISIVTVITGQISLEKLIVIPSEKVQLTKIQTINPNQNSMSGVGAAIATVIVDGYAYLKNQTTHDSIRVLFERIAPSSLLDTTYTATDGYYSIQLETGIYNVTYSKNGYFYIALTNQSFYANTTISSLTLLEHTTLINVPSLFSTIQTAIDHAFEGDTVLVAAGTYVENINYNGKNIVVGSLYLTTSDTSYISSTIIDGNQSGSVVTFNNDEDTTAVLSGFKVINGSAKNGGGIYCSGSSPSLENLIISGNSASNNGGGLWCNYGQPNITNSTIIENSSSRSGGGIFGFASDMNLLNVTIANNSSMGWWNYSGGGGLYLSAGGNNMLKNVLIINNSASRHGGGLYFKENGSSLTNVRIIQNSSISGSGIYCERSDPSLMNVTISGNSASQNGGGISIDPYSNGSAATVPSLANTIVSDNTGNYGIYIDLAYFREWSEDVIPPITYSDFYNNENGNCNICGEWVGVNVTTNANGDSVDAYMNIQLDPLFVDAANGDYNLQQGSPCIDAGDPSSPYDSDGSIADMGAFPSPYGTRVNNTPVIAAVSDVTINEDKSSTVTLSATDVEGDAITYSAVSDTNAVTVSVSSSTLTLTPNANWHGVANIKVYASDGYSKDSTSFKLTVTPVDDISAVQDMTIDEDKSAEVTLTSTFSGTTTFTAVSDTNAVTTSVSSSALTLTPTANWHGVANIKAYASDGTSKDSTSFTLTVTSVNDAPTAFEWVSSALDTINITQSNLADTYTLQWGASTDPIEGDSISYLLYAKIGVNPPEEVFDTTSTSVQIIYQELVENVFEPFPMLPRATVKFSVVATDGIDTVNVTGDDRVLFVNRYEYLSTEGEGIPTVFALHENYPNPFNPTTTLRFDLPEVSDITLTIYNMLGQRVRTFNMNDTPAGYHSVTWNATNDYGDPVGAGVYLYQLQAKGFVKTRKMVLLK